MYKIIALCFILTSSVFASEKSLAKEKATTAIDKANEQERYFNDYVRTLKYKAAIRNKFGIEKTGASTFKAYVYFV